jgi:hypothetical protein
LRLNERRGLAIDGLWFDDVSERPLIGTLAHGYYDDISLAADFYSGHLVFEIPGEAKVTDLSPVEPDLFEGNEWLDIGAEIATPLGPVRKNVRLFEDGSALEIEWHLHWQTWPAGSLRLGHVTLNPAAFPRDALFFRTHNGGSRAETFHFDTGDFDHGGPVSALVSARSGLGMTGGVVELGGADYSLRISPDLTAAAVLGMIQYRQTASSYFCRLSFSGQEMDETRKLGAYGGNSPAAQIVRIRITAEPPSDAHGTARSVKEREPRVHAREVNTQ